MVNTELILRAGYISYSTRRHLFNRFNVPCQCISCTSRLSQNIVHVFSLQEDHPPALVDEMAANPQQYLLDHPVLENVGYPMVSDDEGYPESSGDTSDDGYPESSDDQLANAGDPAFIGQLANREQIRDFEADWLVDSDVTASPHSSEPLDLISPYSHISSDHEIEEDADI